MVEGSEFKRAWSTGQSWKAGKVAGVAGGRSGFETLAIKMRRLFRRLGDGQVSSGIAQLVVDLLEIRRNRR
jgi:hypothetical protein